MNASLVQRLLHEPREVHPRWVEDVRMRLADTPVVVDEHDYVAGTSWPRGAWARDARTGQSRWHEPAIAINGGLKDGPRGLLLGATDASQVVALRGENGSTAWTHDVPFKPSEVTVCGDTAVVRDSGSQLRSLDAATGSERWTRSLPDNLSHPPAVAPDGTVYAFTYGLKLYALDRDTGEPKWIYEARANASSLAVGADGTLYLGRNYGRIAALRPADGSERWSVIPPVTDFNGPTLSVSQDGHTVFAGASSGQVVALRSVDGVLRWQHKAGREPLAAPCVRDAEVVYVGGVGGRITALDAQSGFPLWHFQTPGTYACRPAAASDHTTWFGDDQGRLYAVNMLDSLKETARRMLEEEQRQPAPPEGLEVELSEGRVVIGGVELPVHQIDWHITR